MISLHLSENQHHAAAGDVDRAAGGHARHKADRGNDQTTSILHRSALPFIDAHRLRGAQRLPVSNLTWGYHIIFQPFPASRKSISLIIPNSFARSKSCWKARRQEAHSQRSSPCVHLRKVAFTPHIAGTSPSIMAKPKAEKVVQTSIGYASERRWIETWRPCLGAKAAQSTLENSLYPRFSRVWRARE